MIKLIEYAGKWSGSPDWTQPRILNATTMLRRVNLLLDYMEREHGIEPPRNPVTGSQVSGSTYGGFRPQNCPQGAPNSSHKEGQAVDIYDPQNKLDDALTDEILTQFDLYREHPDATKSWCHLSSRAPRSGKRTFLP